MIRAVTATRFHYWREIKNNKDTVTTRTPAHDLRVARHRHKLFRAGTIRGF